MSARELLELAAKAAGIKVIRSRLDDPMHRDLLVSNSARNPHHETGPWNPRDDDGDALRLAVKLRIGFKYYRNAPPEMGLPQECAVAIVDGQWFAEAGADEEAATRRAITRAAAAIGKAMP